MKADCWAGQWVLHLVVQLAASRVERLVELTVVQLVVSMVVQRVERKAGKLVACWAEHWERIEAD